MMFRRCIYFIVDDTETTEIYTSLHTLTLHYARPILSHHPGKLRRRNIDPNPAFARILNFSVHSVSQPAIASPTGDHGGCGDRTCGAGPFCCPSGAFPLSR